MKIAYLCEFPTLLGGERSLLTFLDAATTRGVVPIVVCPAEGRFANEIRERQLTLVPWQDRAKNSIASAGESLRHETVEVIHANSLSMAGVAVELRTRLKVPAVLHVRDVYRLSRQQWRRVQAFDAVLAVSSYVGRWLHEHGVAEPVLHRIPNAVASIANDPSVAAEDWLQSPMRKVACIGQICLRKGQDLFLHAAERIARDRTDVEFLLIGERYSRKLESEAFEMDLRRLAASGALNGRVRWLGYREDVQALLPYIDVCVVSSRQEPLSRVLLEALATGTPAVATDVGGNREILAGGRFGLLVPTDDAAAMAVAIDRMLDDKCHRDRIRVEGPLQARGLYSPDRQADAIVGLYQHLLGRHQPPAAAPA